MSGKTKGYEFIVFALSGIIFYGDKDSKPSDVERKIYDAMKELCVSFGGLIYYSGYLGEAPFPVRYRDDLGRDHKYQYVYRFILTCQDDMSLFLDVITRLTLSYETTRLYPNFFMYGGWPAKRLDGRLLKLGKEVGL